ncbi:hypothetical protein IMZ48_24900 [Candidatus Bathyarchaeota archaeon]|nr:hypothetical protein [Candidatus Bathyarchaeota archaeon]
MPILMKLDPSESINNMGTLRLDLLDAQDLQAADRNGKSDPFCKFDLNGKEVFKSKTQKKTLNPVWNEFFEVPVPSRLGADFSLSVWDWDLATQPDPLGTANISLGELEPFRPMETRVLLDAKSGSVRLRMMFRPSYVTRTRQGTSTFSAPTRIGTAVAGAPIKAIGTVGANVGKGASFIKRGFRGSKKDDVSPSPSIPEVPTIQTNGSDHPVLAPRATGEGDNEVRPTTAGNGSVGHSRSRSIGQASISSAMPGAGAGTASFSVISASGFPAGDIYVAIVQTSPKTKTVGKTKHHEASEGVVKFDENFKFVCTPDSTFQILVKGHHKLRSDEDFGEMLYFVDDSGAGQAKEVKVKDGVVLIRSSFMPHETAADSPKSTIGRKSFMGRRGREE